MNSGASLLALNQTFGFLAKTGATKMNASSGDVLALDEGLAKTAMGSLSELEQEVAEVRRKDEEEVAALEANAKQRDMLKGVIKKQQEQLAADSSILDGSLEQIQTLASTSPSLGAVTQTS